MFTSCDDYNEYYWEWLYNKAYEFYKDIVDDLWLDMNAVNKFWYLHKFFSLVRKNKFDFADASTKEQHMYLAYNYVFGRTTILPDESLVC